MKTLKEILEGRNIGNFAFAYKVPEGSVEEMFDLLKAEILNPKKYRKTNGNRWEQSMNISYDAQSFYNMLSEIGHPMPDMENSINLRILHKYDPWEEEYKWIWSFNVNLGTKVVTIESAANEKLTVQSFLKKYVAPVLKDFETFKNFASDEKWIKHK